MTGFVCASALGMALGPLLALLLAKVPLTKLGAITLDRITAAGWIMAMVWVAFIVCWLIIFRDPLIECAHLLPLLALQSVDMAHWPFHMLPAMPVFICQI